MLAGEILNSDPCLDRQKYAEENGNKKGTDGRRDTMSTREKINQLLEKVKTEWALKKILSYIRIALEAEGD